MKFAISHVCMLQWPPPALFVSARLIHWIICPDACSQHSELVCLGLMQHPLLFSFSTSDGPLRALEFLVHCYVERNPLGGLDLFVMFPPPCSSKCFCYHDIHSGQRRILIKRAIFSVFCFSIFLLSFYVVFLISFDCSLRQFSSSYQVISSRIFMVMPMVIPQIIPFSSLSKIQFALCLVYLLWHI